ncbi:thiolase C-terminal domain-containing protein [Mycobacterium branderi]|uniref:Nonspecific lipid-transfer protein n=1 Tax=Mycobacterium branderi TaxID=43348 RepID=A0AA91M0E9_9MYCO|nr:nonspecific lipid-transfer protein [Mycobacterium branderi]MCV7231636.1 nonspecific lipid-transfer protein [Mycobacterium branderi]ORA40476.1 nonspecific lipid-transfer protein [Mycobacterium branderi]
MTCAVIGIGRTLYSRSSGRTTGAMAVQACREAITDAGLACTDVDGICTYMVNDSEQPIYVGWALGIEELAWANAMYGGGNLVADQIATAAAVIEAGMCRAVLVYRSLNGRSGHRFGSVEGPMRVGHEGQFDTVSGFLVPPQWFAMWARRHQYVYGSTCEDLGQIAITQRKHAGPNEHALRREPLTMDDYLAARWINEPFRVLDCTSEADGAVAILIAGEDIARDSAQTPTWLVGSSNSQSGAGWTGWDDPTEMYARSAGPKIWARTGLTPADIDVACMYDCFTYTVMATMEGYGFCEKGEVGTFFSSGRATYGGDVVVNPHGGLLSEGYIHGLNHHYEAALQLRHAAGDRQVDDAQLALVTAGGGPFGGANIYSREHP